MENKDLNVTQREISEQKDTSYSQLCTFLAAVHALTSGDLNTGRKVPVA